MRFRTRAEGDPPPLCRCNCGEPVKAHKQTRRLRGQVAGVTYNDYVVHHHPRGKRPSDGRLARGREAQRLVHDDGLDYRVAAAEMGVSLTVFHQLISDPDGSKARARSLRHRAKRMAEDPAGFLRNARARARRYQHARLIRDTPLDHTTARAADGPRVYAWICERNLYVELEPNQRRAAQRWRDGGIAQIDALDRLLVSRGLQLVDLPEDVWIARARP